MYSSDKCIHIFYNDAYYIFLSYSQIRKSAKFRKMNEGANGTLNYSSKFAGKVLLYQYQFVLF